MLDLACGDGYLVGHLPDGCRYFGVDRLMPTDTARFAAFLQCDLSQPQWVSIVGDWLPEPPTIITMVAFLEHLREPTVFLRSAAKLLASGGRCIGTTPHPLGRVIHETLAKVGLCSRHGADDHEDFLNREQLRECAEGAGLKLTTYRKFLGGLNQVFEMRAAA